MVTLTEEESRLPYAKYFYRPLAPIPQDKLDIAAGPAASPGLALPLEEKNRFLSGEDDGLQAGFCVMENGLGYVANRTFMPGVTVEMCDWWFGWHCVESDLRYKLWDHDDHYYARADRVDYVRDPKVPWRQKTWGVRHHVLEDIGFGPEEVTLCFKKPSDFGYDQRLVGSNTCTSMACAIGEGQSPAFMTHKFVAVEGGTLLESRFWMGVGFRDGKLFKLLPEGVSVPEAGPRALFAHGIKEFSNLAAILPALYAEEGADKPNAR